MSDIEHGVDVVEEVGGECKYMDEQSVTDGTSVSSVAPSRYLRKWSPCLLSCAVLFLGGSLTSAFLTVGIMDEKEANWHHFEQSASDTARLIRSAWLQYETFSLWAHESCHQLAASTRNSTELDDILHMCSREEFRNIYEQIISVGLDVHSLQYVPKVEHRYREEAEAESKSWLEEFHPEVTYQGFTARKWTDEGPLTFPAPLRPFYFPIRRIEPFHDNEAVYDYDTFYSSSELIGSVLETQKPALSPPFKLAQDKDASGHSVFLTHPGAKTSVLTEGPHSVVAMIVRISDLLTWAGRGTLDKKVAYLYDSTGESMAFLGGISIRPSGKENEITLLQEVAFKDVPVPKRSREYVTTMNVVDRQWTVVIAPLDSSDAPTPAMSVLGAAVIFVIFAMLAFLLRRYLARKDVINTLVFNNKNDKAHAYHKQVMRERRLNEYLA